MRQSFLDTFAYVLKIVIYTRHKIRILIFPRVDWYPSTRRVFIRVDRECFNTFVNKRIESYLKSSAFQLDMFLVIAVERDLNISSDFESSIIEQKIEIISEILSYNATRLFILTTNAKKNKFLPKRWLIRLQNKWNIEVRLFYCLIFFSFSFVRKLSHFFIFSEMFTRIGFLLLCLVSNAYAWNCTNPIVDCSSRGSCTLWTWTDSLHEQVNAFLLNLDVSATTIILHLTRLWMFNATTNKPQFSLLGWSNFSLGLKLEPGTLC